jgi:hypothetical protein
MKNATMYRSRSRVPVFGKKRIGIDSKLPIFPRFAIVKERVAHVLKKLISISSVELGKS